MKKTQNDVPILAASDARQADVYVDAAFAVHGDYKSHSGMVLPLEKGVLRQDLRNKRLTLGALLSLNWWELMTMSLMCCGILHL